MNPKALIPEADIKLLERILAAAAVSGLVFSDAHRAAAVNMLLTGVYPEEPTSCSSFAPLPARVLEIAVNRITRKLSPMRIQNSLYPCGDPMWIAYSESLTKTLDTYAAVE